MKVRHSLIPGLVAGAMLFGGIGIAQDAPAPATSPTMSESATHSATYQTAQGEVVINSVPAAAADHRAGPGFRTAVRRQQGDHRRAGGFISSAGERFPPCRQQQEQQDQSIRVHALGKTAQLTVVVRER